MNYTPNYSMKLPGYGDNADIADLNENTTTIDELIHDNRTMIAQAYSQLESYVVGDIVENEGKLYRCIGATSGNWDSTKWTRTTLGDEVEEAGASALSDLDDVEITSPSEGQILRRNANGDWVNTDMPDMDVTKTASGNPIEVSDSANAPLVKCVSAITGSQDLHGYDKPWVGGAGKNKLPMTVDSIKSFNTSAMGYTWVGNSCSVYGVTYTLLTDNGNNVIGIKATSNGAASGNATLYIYGSNTMSPADLPITQDSLCTMGLSGSEYTYRGIVWKASGGQFIDGGSVAIESGDTLRGFGIRVISGYTIPTEGIVFLPMLRASGTTADYEPYSNICSITAYTEGKIVERGKNLLKSNATSQTKEGVTFVVNSDGSITANGTASAAFTLELQSYQKLSDYGITAETYTISGGYGTSTAYLMLGISGSGREFRDSMGNGFSFTPTEAELEKSYRVILVFASGTVLNNVTFYPMIEKGSTATTYEAYKGTTHTTTYPSAIYKGSEDVVNGEVECEKKMITISGGMVLYGNYGDDNAPLFYFDTDDENIAVYNNATAPEANKLLSNFYTATSASTNAGMQDFEFRTGSGTTKDRIYFRDSRFTTAADFNTWLASNPLQIVYKLDTPTTSSVTPTNLPVKSLSGYTHIESSTGEMEIEYIAKNFQPLLDLMKKMVVANPSESATTTLSSLKVDDTVYSLPSGGGVTSIATDRNSYTLEVS